MVGAALAVAVAAVVLLAAGWLPGLPSGSTEAGVSGPARGTHTTPPIGPGPSSPSGTSTGAPPPSGGGTNGSGAGGNGTGTGSGSGSGNGSSAGNGSGSGNHTAGWGNGSRGGAGPYPGINGTLVVGPPIATVSTSFFQLVIQTPNLTEPSLWASMNATPFSYYQFGSASETTNQLTGIAYADNGTQLPPTRSNDSNFVIFCRIVHCHAIMAVPTEIDNTTIAVQTAQYIEQTLGFHPDYWMVGGEPQGWTHWGIPWTSWNTSDNSTPTPLQYAQELQQYVVALHGYDPSMKLIGIESADGGKWFKSQWLSEVALIDGPNLTAVAIHPYPDGVGTSNETATNFFASLSNPLNFPNNYPGLLKNLDLSCNCSLPIWVGEYNAALDGNFSSFMTSYAEVPYIGAGIAGAMKAGIPQLDFFAYSYGSESLVSATGAPLPVYSLFATFFKNLTLGTVDNSSISGGPGGVFAVTTTNGNTTSVLVVSTNLTASLNLTLILPGGPVLGGAGHGWHSWWWNATAPAPVEGWGGSYLPETWTIPPEGILLVNAD